MTREELEAMLDEQFLLNVRQAMRMRAMEVALKKCWNIMEEPIGKVGERLYLILEPFENALKTVRVEELEDENEQESQ